MPLPESPGPPWLARPFYMPHAIDPIVPTAVLNWGRTQTGLTSSGNRGGERQPMIYALPNPSSDKTIQSLTIRGLSSSPLIVAGLTLYRGSGHPLRHLPRRMFRVTAEGKPVRHDSAEIDLGVITRISHTAGARRQEWLDSPHTGTETEETEQNPEDLLEIVGAADATVSVKLEEREEKECFSLGEAFRTGASEGFRARLEVLGSQRRWVSVKVIDASTGKPAASTSLPTATTPRSTRTGSKTTPP